MFMMTLCLELSILQLVYCIRYIQIYYYMYWLWLCRLLNVLVSFFCWLLWPANISMESQGENSITVTSLVTETSQKGSECQANPPKKLPKVRWWNINREMPFEPKRGRLSQKVFFCTVAVWVVGLGHSFVSGHVTDLIMSLVSTIYMQLYERSTVKVHL